MCMHGIGKNIKHYGADHVVWGTDCLWWGSPQWAIDAFKRFQISDELCEKFGYKKITKEDKAKIFGLNAAKLYNVDVKAKRNAIPGDALEKAKMAYLDAGGARQNAAYGWVRAERLSEDCRATSVCCSPAPLRAARRRRRAQRGAPARAFPSRSSQRHRSRGRDPVLHEQVQGAQGIVRRSRRRGLDRRLVAAVHEGRRAAAERAAVRHLAHRLGRGGHAVDVSAAARQGHALRHADHRHQRHGRRQPRVLLRVRRRARSRADRAQHGAPSQLRARAHVQRRSAGRGRVVREAARRAQLPADARSAFTRACRSRRQRS